MWGRRMPWTSSPWPQPALQNLSHMPGRPHPHFLWADGAPRPGTGEALGLDPPAPSLSDMCRSTLGYNSSPAWPAAERQAHRGFRAGSAQVHPGLLPQPPHKLCTDTARFMQSTATCWGQCHPQPSHLTCKRGQYNLSVIEAQQESYTHQATQLRHLEGACWTCGMHTGPLAGTAQCPSLHLLGSLGFQGRVLPWGSHAGTPCPSQQPRPAAGPCQQWLLGHTPQGTQGMRIALRSQRRTPVGQ